MNPRYILFLLGLGLLSAPAYVSAEEKDKVEVLARGPVHEAYAEPTEREPLPSPIINKEPPKLIEELPPDQKPEGDNVQWIPGYWSYDEDRKDYLWVSGFWRIAPPGRSWVPGSWRRAGDGWQWTGGIWAAPKEQKAEVEYLPRPPAPLDNDGANTPAPSAEHIYVPGSWVWRERYVWRPGFWMEHRPGWVWTSAHYRWTPGGYVYIDGYWDYPLATRGTLFAPVYIPPVVYADPAYVYTPTVYVREQCLFGAFFTRRGFGSYYFGDYFAPRYAEVGFVSWCGYTSASVRIGGFYDPLFSYYSCGYRSDPFWGGGGCVNLFVGRYRGDYARPPQTLVQQTTVINNITNNNITNIDRSKNNTNIIQNSNLNNVTMLSSIRDGSSDGRRFHTVNDTARADQQAAARNLRDVATRRADAETRLAAGGPKGNNGPRTIGLDVPPVRPVRGTGGSETGVGTGTAGGNPPKGGPGVGIPPKGGIGMNPGTGTGVPPKGGIGANPGTGVPPKGGPTVGIPPKGGMNPGTGINPGTGMGTGTGSPPPPKATPIGKDPKGVVIPPRTDPKLPGTGGPTLPPPRPVNNPPMGGTGTGNPPVGGTGVGNPSIPPKGPVGGTGTGSPPTIPPKTITNPPVTTPPTRPPVTNPPVTMPPTRPPVTTPPPKSNPPVTMPPAVTPKSNPPATPPKVAPKTKSTFEPTPIVGNTPTPSRTVTPLPAPRPAVTPLAQPRPLVTSPAPLAQPRIAAPRPAVAAPAMVNPRPIATPRIAPPVVAPRPAPAIAPRPAPAIAPRPAAIPSGAAKRPIRR